MTVSRGTTPGRSGRRPGPSTTREAIALAAREQFAEAGYDRATIRAIAAAAGVDPALVIRFYGSKEALFLDVMAVPEEVAAAIFELGDGPRETIGRRLAQVVADALENPATRSIILGRIRSASSHPDAAALVRETVTRDLARLARSLSSDRPETRAVLVGAHVVGIALARYVVRVEPLASASADEVVEYLAPTFQRYLVEPLEEAASAGS